MFIYLRTHAHTVQNIVSAALFIAVAPKMFGISGGKLTRESANAIVYCPGRRNE